MEALFQCEMKCTNVTVERITNTSVHDYVDCKDTECALAKEIMKNSEEGSKTHYAYEECIRNATFDGNPHCVACGHQWTELSWESDFPAEVCQGCYEGCAHDGRLNSSTFDAFYGCEA